jgi:membrane dipeptidase
MNPDELHRDAVVIDGLIIANWSRTIGEFPNLTAAMHRAGWNETRIRKVIGGNWLALLDEVWKA